MIFLFLFAADMQVHIDARALPNLRINVVFKTPVDRMCTNIVGGGRGIKGLTPLADDPDCFQPASAYHVDLKALDNDNPDFAASVGKAWIFNDQAVILRPEPLPDTFDVDVTVDGSAHTVWPSKDGKYSANRDALDGGTYWGLGTWETLPALKIAGREVGLVKAVRSSKASNAVLGRWVERALKAVASFHGMLPAERMLVFISPMPLSSTAGIFGSILRRHWATAALLYGANAPDAEFDGEWMAVHELFHSVMPHIRTRPAWFIEGFTTYYQDVLRARAGMQSAKAMWDDLHDGVVRFCQPHGRSLEQESNELRKRHAYQRVYWGGACLALQVDVSIRARSNNRESLDTVLKQAWRDSMQTPLEPADMIARLDAAAGEPITQRMLSETGNIDFAPLYAKLGLNPHDESHIDFISNAPLIHVRNNIMSDAQR